MACVWVHESLPPRFLSFRQSMATSVTPTAAATSKNPIQISSTLFILHLYIIFEVCIT
jgi:hypothetical protein